jgi:hypothetical protein
MTTPDHKAPEKDNEICWLLDVRAYGIEAANKLHKDSEDTTQSGWDLNGTSTQGDGWR